MNYAVIVLMCITLFFSALAIGLLKIQKEQIDEESKGNEPSKLYLLLTKDHLFWGWSILMLIMPIFVMLRMYYHEEKMLFCIRALLILLTVFICAWTDLAAFLIKNKVLLIALLLRFVVFGIEMLTSPEGIKSIVVSGLIAAFALAVVSLLCKILTGGVGAGDVKLLAVMGLYLGVEYVGLCVFYSMIAMFVFSLGVLLLGKGTRKTEIPFAPFLLIGTCVGFLM